MLVSLAFRNLWRHKGRTLITMAGIAFGIMLMLTSMALNDGAWAGMIRNAVEGSAGHVVVQRQGWQEERLPEDWLPEARELQRALASAYPEGTVVRRTFVGGLITSPTGSSAIELKGLQPELERDLTMLDDRLVEGEWLEGDRDLMIGLDLATTLGVEVGDKVVFMAQAGTDEVESVLYRVKGIYRTGGEALDSFAAYATIDSTQPLFTEADVAHQVAVVLPWISKRGGVDLTAARAAAADVPHATVLSWDEALPALQEQAAMDAQFGYVLYGVMGAIVAVGVMNTILMSVMERTRELGVMLAVGLRPGQLVGMVLAEGMLLGTLGGVSGVLLAVGPVLWLEANGIDYGDLMSSASPVASVPIDTVMRAQFDFWKMAVVGAIAAVVATLAALWPAWRAARLRPVEAIHHV